MSGTEIRILGEIDPNSELGSCWESLVKACPESGIMQSLHWARMKRLQRMEAMHLGLFEKGILVGGAIFYTGKKLNGTGIMVAPEGPVLPWHDPEKSAQYLRLLKDEAETYARAGGIISMRIEPRLFPPAPQYLREFARAPVDLVPRETLYVDLSGSEEAVFAAMKHKGRYNIKLAEKNGVRISESTTSDAVQKFYSAVSEASRRDDFALESQDFFARLAQALIPSGHATFLFAEHDGDLLGSLILITYGERATYLYGGVTNTKRNLMGGYALQWQAMKNARQAGCKTYDFYGYVPHRSPEHEYARFSQFESRFGGNPVRFTGAQEYFFMDNFADTFIRAAEEISNAAVK